MPAKVIFYLSACDDTGRVILDSDTHGDTLAVLEARTWAKARRMALRNKVMDPYSYKAGHGWIRRKHNDGK